MNNNHNLIMPVFDKLGKRRGNKNAYLKKGIQAVRALVTLMSAHEHASAYGGAVMATFIDNINRPGASHTEAYFNLDVDQPTRLYMNAINYLAQVSKTVVILRRFISRQAACAAYMEEVEQKMRMTDPAALSKKQLRLHKYAVIIKEDKIRTIIDQHVQEALQYSQVAAIGLPLLDKTKEYKSQGELAGYMANHLNTSYNQAYELRQQKEALRFTPAVHSGTGTQADSTITDAGPMEMSELE